MDLEPMENVEPLKVGDIVCVVTPNGVTKVRVTEAPPPTVDEDGELSYSVRTEPVEPTAATTPPA